ncbi:MAG TPA: sigma-70 family RNA polymerase sigma factor [Gemmatimonadaceae bacterium]|jgi:RNA polymerase sigma factor (sigma-70 family)|nr:sigma-70 family RNA polymerase sigma factor [Gemmatimonadaceae bacterium]
MNSEERFLANVPTIERIAAFYCRRMHLSDADTEDFVSYVKLELIERNYDIIEKFEGRSSFTTYLTTVIHRLLYQHRTKEWGKWRPSAEAKRMGDVAIALERLTTRDGYSLNEAFQLMTTGSPPAASRRELEAIALRLPPRIPRPMLVTEEAAPDLVAASDDPSDGPASREREQIARRAASVLDTIMTSFDPEDRLILKMRFWSAQRIADIAATLHLDAKKTYKRIDKLLGKVRGALERAGIGRKEIDDLFAHGDRPVEIAPAVGIPSTRPSKPAGDIGGGESRLSGR